jgi:isoquinoline 1-oxidoreductase beta subunit
MPVHCRTATKATTKGRSDLRDPGRRRFLGFLVAAPTLAVAVRAGYDQLFPTTAAAAVPSPPQPADVYDLSDALTDSAAPTANLISIVVHPDGTVSFDLPRSENGQGITTAVAMIIAEEMDLPVEMVKVTLADARPELVFNQITGGSNTIHAMYTPIRVAAAIAKGRLLSAAAALMEENVSRLTSRQGLVTGPAGTVLSYGELAGPAASSENRMVEAPPLKPESEFTVVGTPITRIDARAAVTGTKVFTMDLDVPGAKPTMICRPPTIRGTVQRVRNADTVAGMPGVHGVKKISTGVAVCADTFGQCIDAVRALEVDWNAGSVAPESDATVLDKLRSATLPIPPDLPGAEFVQTEYVFAFRSGSPLETNCAIADVGADKAEVWSPLKNPITAQEEIAKLTGLPLTSVTVHVTEGGGSFGRHLFNDPAKEAAEASQAFGHPVKLMWHRTDDSRHGRTHPMCISTVKAGVVGTDVVSYQQNHTSVETDYRHGFGDAISSRIVKTGGPLANLSVAQSIFSLTAKTSYNYGVTAQLLNEVPLEFNTSSVRNVYSPDVRIAQELTTDQLAAKLGEDPYGFRRARLKTDLQRKVLDEVADAGDWGRSLPDGMAQGIAVHEEYKNTMAALVEIDCRPQTVGRKIRQGRGGPRVTRATYVLVPGKLCINPSGMKAQIMGGLMDAIAQVLTGSLHLRDGINLEGSWDDYFYTRQWNVPPEVEVIILPPDPNGEVPGGGEAGVAASAAAIACAYGRATGTVPTYFPISHNDPLGFEVKSLEPPLPPAPTDGLDHTF